jgi:hypothetical protein
VSVICRLRRAPRQEEVGWAGEDRGLFLLAVVVHSYDGPLPFLEPFGRKHRARHALAITHSARRGFAACRRCAPNRRPQVSLRSAATALLSDFRSALTLCFRSMDLTREWRWTRNEKSLVPPMTTDLAPVSRLTREIRGLQQLGHCEHHRAALSLA